MNVSYKKALDEVLKIREERNKIYGDSWESDLKTNYYQVKNKFERIKMMIENLNLNSYESLKDQFVDLTNYSLFCLALIIQQEDEKNINI